MGQREGPPAFPHFVAALLILGLFTFVGCDRPTPVASTGKHPTVASLSPAATDILIAIGAQDHLVAISNYDRGKPAISQLPTAGDYLTVDWERMASLKPDLIVMQAYESTAPAGFKQRAAELGIKPVFIHIDKLADISTATKTLGDAVNEPAKASAADQAMRDKLAAVAKSVANEPRVRTLVITDEVGAGAAGTGTFLDELLTIAGGTNAAAGEGSGYPGVDREKVVALKPDVVLHLLPDKPPTTVADAKRYWASMPDVPAVRDGRVYILTESSVMQPGLKVGDVAELFAARLHPHRPSTSQPATRDGPHVGRARYAAPPRILGEQLARPALGESGAALCGVPLRSAPACGPDARTSFVRGRA
jgi:iron complex transport system substrate-binding protein